MSDNGHRDLERAFIDAHAAAKGGSTPAFSIQFYPYSGLRHTIRARSGHITVRLSDICSGAPVAVLQALVTILVYRLFRRRVPRSAEETYRVFAGSSEVRERTRQIRSQRSRKQLGSARGQVFDLDSLFANLNDVYFAGSVRVSQLGWSARPGRRILGHYDPAHKTISVSRSLDHPLVPQYVVEYVLYHEMLHVVFDEEQHEGRRRIHHKRFRQAERRFERFEAAKQFVRSHL